MKKNRPESSETEMTEDEDNDLELESTFIFDILDADLITKNVKKTVNLNIKVNDFCVAKFVIENYEAVKHYVGKILRGSKRSLSYDISV